MADDAARHSPSRRHTKNKAVDEKLRKKKAGKFKDCGIVLLSMILSDKLIRTE
jgi:hypothetical protein